MRPYTFYLHNMGRPNPVFDFVHCDDDEEATAHAQELLTRFPEYDRIEIYDGHSPRLAVRRQERAANLDPSWASRAAL